MQLDYNSLLLALAISSICVVMALMSSWLTRRTDTFLLTCISGLGLLIVGIVVYGAYVQTDARIFAATSSIIFMFGFSMIAEAACQFRFNTLSHHRIALRSVLAILATQPFFWTGYSGVALIADNLADAVILFETAWHYWRGRKEAPTPLFFMSLLYATTATSFLLCAAVLVSEWSLVIDQAPDNWAEKINIVASLAGISGIGALSLALHHWRQATFHRHAAMTDALTGMMNRRALFDLYDMRAFNHEMAVVVVDIDHFKSINDRHGHAAGDIVLQHFAEIMLSHLRVTDHAARLGGEEFALVFDNIRVTQAIEIAERLRQAAEHAVITVGGHRIQMTVSAGIAFGAPDRMAFTRVLEEADRALYVAKHSGRNRIEVSGHAGRDDNAVHECLRVVS